MDRQGEGRRSPAGGQAPLLVLLLVATLLVLLGFFVHGDYSAPTVALAEETTTSTTLAAVETSTSTSTSTTVPQTTTTEGLFHAIGDPSRLVIPAINVDAKIVPVGLTSDGSMQTPSTGKVGWYELGPVPGEQGPAVLIGHVDNTKGADVFYRLKRLEPGDEIYVWGDDDSPAVFVVDSLEEHLKIDLPKDRIWEYTGTAVIRLITCGGTFDRTTHHYLSNLIVYGHLVR